MQVLIHEPPSAGNRNEVIDQLETHVQSQLNGRIRDFRVQVRERGLILRGQTRTYYAKQLAQQAVMQISAWPILANEIEVS
jgi:osmotically-inducible protein OsmY